MGKKKTLHFDRDTTVDELRAQLTAGVPGSLAQVMRDAASLRRGDIVDVLIEHGVSDEVLADGLAFAAHAKDRKTMQLLLARGAKSDDALAFAAGEAYDPRATTEKEHVACVQLLLDDGADVNASGNTGSALMAALQGGNVRVVELIAARGGRLLDDERSAWVPAASAALAIRAGLSAQALLVNALTDSSQSADGEERRALCRIALEGGADPNAASADAPAPFLILLGQALAHAHDDRFWPPYKKLFLEHGARTDLVFNVSYDANTAGDLATRRHARFCEPAKKGMTLVAWLTASAKHPKAAQLMADLGVAAPGVVPREKRATTTTKPAKAARTSAPKTTKAKARAGKSSARTKKAKARTRAR